MMRRETSIADLHKLALARGLPRAEVHEILHELAVANFDVQSLTELHAGQRTELAALVKAHYAAPPRPPSKRPRRGRPARAGVTRLITTPQRELIFKLVNQLNWSASIFANFLRRYFEIDSPESIATSAQASAVINALIAEDKRRRRAASPKR